jgi:hypothetical protein
MPQNFTERGSCIPFRHSHRPHQYDSKKSKIILPFQSSKVVLMPKLATTPTPGKIAALSDGLRSNRQGYCTIKPKQSRDLAELKLFGLMNSLPKSTTTKNYNDVLQYQSATPPFFLRFIRGGTTFVAFSLSDETRDHLHLIIATAIEKCELTIYFSQPTSLFLYAKGSDDDSADDIRCMDVRTYN